jgi:hypothetical protein
MTKSSIVKSKATTSTTAPKVSRARKSDTAASGPNAVMLMRDQIALRAYELYIARGYQDGHDVEDWLSAEAELTQRQ